MASEQIIMSMIGGLAILMLTLWKSTNTKIEKLDEKVTDIDRRLCRLEGAFSKQECCMLKEHKHASSE